MSAITVTVDQFAFFRVPPSSGSNTPPAPQHARVAFIFPLRAPFDLQREVCHLGLSIAGQNLIHTIEKKEEEAPGRGRLYGGLSAVQQEADRIREGPVKVTIPCVHTEQPPEANS